MSTTSSAEKYQQYENVPRASSKTEDQYITAPPYNYGSSSEQERRRRRPVTDKSAESRMHQYSRARKEIDPAKQDIRNRRTPSIEPSRSEGSRSSPANRFTGSRIGKRIRRRPQRWEGERSESRLQRASIGMMKEETHLYRADDESTVSLNSCTSDTEPPVVDSPFADLRKAIAACDLQPNKRDMVDWFHSWQLRAVSKQAAQQKALHVFLKRRLRKRTTRSPEHDRMEEESLRNARLAIFADDKLEDQLHEHGHVLDPINEDFTVPNKVRLPLEAYMPRRMSSNSRALTPQELLAMVPPAPQLPDVFHNGKTPKEQWMTLPTVTASSQWNSRKSNGRRRAFQQKSEPITKKVENASEP